MEHTPGPWKYDETLTSEHTCPIYTDDAWIATAFMGYGMFKGDVEKADAEVLANARLIAAAPDLLEACRHAARSEHHSACKCHGEYAGNPEQYCTCHVQKARAAIAKAVGK
jgi:hypothetical protein